MIVRHHACRLLPLALTVLLAAPAVSFAQEPGQGPRMPLDNTAAMKRIAWLAGTWVGESALGDYGKVRFKYTFTWTMNKNFLKADSWMWRGEKIMWHDTGMVGWDKDNNKYTSFIFGLDGTIGTATEVKPSDPQKTTPKTKLVMDGQTTGNSPYKRFRWLMLQVDADTMIVDQLTFREGKYESMGKTTLKRVKPKKSKDPKAKASGPKTEKLQSA